MSGIHNLSEQYREVRGKGEKNSVGMTKSLLFVIGVFMKAEKFVLSAFLLKKFTFFSIIKVVTIHFQALL
jgi:hypothetical protein